MYIEIFFIAREKKRKHRTEKQREKMAKMRKASSRHLLSERFEQFDKKYLEELQRFLTVRLFALFDLVRMVESVQAITYSKSIMFMSVE